ncbi:MAG: AAA family ATPase [Proteobacteria bacterium]|nr:AAA family ATPase [Pseudomonadota bacterium]
MANVANGGERRQLTVMFCDIVDSTPLSTRFDPEDLREIIRRFQDACVAAIEPYDGWVAQHLGDGLLIYFGYPRAHEDDALRAGHAGLGVVQAVRALQPAPGVQLQVRVGIATGKVVIGEHVGAGGPAERLAVGSTPNLAARLQALAEPDTVVISPHTRRLLGQAFEFKDLGVRTLKGIAEPMRVRQIIGPSARLSRFAAAHGLETLPIVGRDGELQLLRQCADKAVQHDGHAVLVRGEPGIGKSRLVRAHVEEICAQHGILPVELQCSPYHNQSALFPVLDWWQAIFLAHGAMSDAEKCKVIETLVGRTAIDPAQAVPCLAMLLSLPVPPGYAPLNLTADRQKRLTLQYLADLVKQLYPLPLVLLVVEDLHWADPSTLELIGLWLAGSPGSTTHTLMTSRAEFVPPWAAQDNIAAVELGRLPDAPALELVRLAAGEVALRDSLQQELLRKSDCIPLYLEMLTRHFVDHAQPQPAPARAEGAAAEPASTIPESLQDALMARLDHMGETKSVAQVAAILGRDFDRQLLDAVWTGSPAALERGLAELEKADLVQTRSDRSRGQYRFKHALIRDVAYDSLLKRHCEALHAHIAEVMENRFPELAARQPDVLAQHYTAGKKRDPAMRYWHAAGRLAMKSSSAQEAVAHFSRGLALLEETPPSPERDVRELDFRIVLGHALMTWKGYAADEVKASCDRVSALCTLVGNTPLLPAALYQQVAYNIVSANLDTALAMSERFCEIAQNTPGDDLLIEGDVTLGLTQFFRGEFTASRQQLEHCLQMYTVERHGGHAFLFGHDPGVLCYVYLIWIYWLQGRQPQALQASQQAVALARRLAHPLSFAFALAFAGWHCIFCRDDEGAQAYSEELIAYCSEQHILIFLAHGYMIKAWVAGLRGQTEPGLQGLQSGLELFRMTGARHFLPHWQGHLAATRAAAGHTEGTEAALALWLERTHSTREHWSEAELHRYRGTVLAKLGRPAADIEACFQRAIEVAQSQGALAWEARARLDLAQHLLDQGRAGEARELLDRLRSEVAMDIDAQMPARIEALMGQCAEALVRAGDRAARRPH